MIGFLMLIIYFFLGVIDVGTEVKNCFTVTEATDNKLCEDGI